MAKKKSNSSAAKAAKKVKATQKTERKEKKKVTKSKSKYDSEEEDDQDLEAILEKVYPKFPSQANKVNCRALSVDEKRMGGGSYCYRRAC
jgi:hypothetical protein